MKSARDHSTNQSAERQAPITVVVADDHPAIREGLVKILESEKDIKIVAEAEDGEEVCVLYDQFLPDVLILDLRLPKKDGIQVLHQLMSRRLSKPRVIIMTSYDSEHDICQAARAGVKAFLVKAADPQQIREAVRLVADGETCLRQGLNVQFFPFGVVRPQAGIPRQHEAQSACDLGLVGHAPYFQWYPQRFQPTTSAGRLPCTSRIAHRSALRDSAPRAV
jgi:DNA-binding NarL/FixJ family response regulator